MIETISPRGNASRRDVVERDDLAFAFGTVVVTRSSSIIGSTFSTAVPGRRRFGQIM